MRRIFLLPLSLSLALGTASCAEAPTLAPGVCGNGVVDPGEDCDGFPDANGFACRAPDVAWRCSFQCKAEDHSCPVGYGCGIDDVCRKATGAFAPSAFAVAPSQAEELLTGDFDGDRRADIVSLEAGRFRVSFIDDAGTVQQASLSSDARPAVGKVGSLNVVDTDSVVDTTDDIVLPLHLGIGTLLSQGDRTFTAKTYASVTLGNEMVMGVGKLTITGVVPLAFDALPDIAHPGDETAALASIRMSGKDKDESYSVLVNFGAGGSEPVFQVPDTHPADLSGPVVERDFDEADKCQEAIFPKTGATTLQVFKSCAKTKDGFEWIRLGDNNKPLVSTVDVGGTISGPVFPYDVNSDGHMDLLITATVNGALQLRVAYGIGNGTFHSQDPIGQPPPGGQGDGATSPEADLDAAPLALGKLNDDAFPDIVDATHVRLGAPTGNGGLSFGAVVYQSQHPWTEAVIARINADLYADVVASSDSSPDIDVLTGNPSPLLNPFTISTDGNVAHLQIGDYDGDLINDIAFQEALSSDQSLLMIAYGSPFGGPEAPQQIGNFPNIQSIVSGNVLTFGADAISDLGILSSFPTTPDVSSIKEAFAISFFPGASDRFLQAPFLLAEEPDNRLEVPIETAIGFLRPWTKDSGEEAHNDVAIVAYAPPQYGPKGPNIEQDVAALRLWGLFATGDADFLATESAHCNIPTGAFFFPGMRDALSVVVTSTAIGEKGKTYVATPEVANYKDPAKAHISALITDASFDTKTSCTFGPAFHTAAGELLFRLKAFELNGNDTPEILAVRKKYDPALLLQIAQQSAMPGGGGSAFAGADTSELVIFWDGVLGSDGTLAPYLPAGQPTMVTDFTAGDIDGDGKPELLVVGRSGGVAYKLGGDKKSLEVSPAPHEDLADAKAVLYADADGDGVLDLIVAQSGLQFFAGISKKEVPIPQ